jgi:indolepyruvate ferredoxin oxidoreductase beta subunit
VTGVKRLVKVLAVLQVILCQLRDHIHQHERGRQTDRAVPHIAEIPDEEGQADVLIAFERLEALRYAHFLKKDGVIIVNDQRIDPMPVVTGVAKYPDGIIEKLSKKYRVVSVDAMDEAIKMGNSRVFNVIILGIAAKNMDFPKEQWIEVIKKTVPPKTIDINVAAFEKGYELA